jgi:hypothetical protein
MGLARLLKLSMNGMGELRDAQGYES